jgi:hypothetical protein
MRTKISVSAWVVFGLSVLALIVLTWGVDLHAPGGIARAGASAMLLIVSVINLLTGGHAGARLSNIEAGRYPRLTPGASGRIRERLQNETPQTVTIDAEGGDDIRAVATEISKALKAARWDVQKLHLNCNALGRRPGHPGLSHRASSKCSDCAD